MSIYFKVVTVDCDVCGIDTEVGIDSWPYLGEDIVTVVKRELVKRGWSFRGSNHYCPKHSEEKR